MPKTPVRFDLEGELLAAQAEAAARRRLRILENTFPAVIGWEVATRSRPAANASGGREAHVAATIAGGDRIEASACSGETLGALRLAFNALEARLNDESENARQRAFHWFQKVRRRTAANWFAAD